MSPGIRLAGGRLLATEFRLTITFVLVPGASVPDCAVTPSQVASLVIAQLKDVSPELLTAYVWVCTLKGPPTGPIDAKPLPGVMTRGSWTVKANGNSCT